MNRRIALAQTSMFSAGKAPTSLPTTPTSHCGFLLLLLCGSNLLFRGAQTDAQGQWMLHMI